MALLRKTARRIEDGRLRGGGQKWLEVTGPSKGEQPNWFCSEKGNGLLGSRVGESCWGVSREKI